MQFVSYEGTPLGWGVSIPDGVIDGSQLLGGSYGSLKAVIEAGVLVAAAHEAERLRPSMAHDGLTLLPPVPDPMHVFCAGLNYADHAAETGKDTPEIPRIFLRAASSLVGHGAPLIRPRVSTDFDFEGELAVIIGKRGHHIAPEAAMDHIAGYCCFMDGSLRDWQKNTTTMGKNFAGTGAMGPGLVPASHVPDWRALSLETRVNGQSVQQVSMDRMIHSIEDMIAYLSRMTPLLPGDVVVTGTPEGIGCRRIPPMWLKPGDLVEVDIPGVGLLANTVVEET